MRPFAPERDTDGSKRHIHRVSPFGCRASERVDWVDYAKGICIVMVVMMHSVLGVEAAAGQTGFMHPVVAFAKPFRMPDFFLISGLFLPVVIDRGWRTYLDRKVVHFAYFYLLWVTIQFGFKAPVVRRRDRLGPCRPAVSGILHRAVRHAVVHLPAAGVLRRHQGDPTDAAAGDLGGGGAAGDGASRDRLDRDRRILRPLRLYLFRLSVRRAGVRIVRSRPGASRACACGAGPMGAGQWRPGGIGRSEWPLVSLALGLAGRLRHHHARHAAGADELARISCAFAASIPSSSIWRSSCRWPRRGRCCCAPG